MNRADLDHRLARDGEFLTVLAQPAAAREPRKGSLDDPTLGQYGPFHISCNTHAANTSAMQQRKNIPCSNSRSEAMAVSFLLVKSLSSSLVFA